MMRAFLMGLLVCVSATSLLAADKPNVLIIGDSISGGYRPHVVQHLAGHADVTRIPENGKDTRNGLAKIDVWLGDTQWDVICFNWGLHDMKKGKPADLDRRALAYRERLTSLVQRLRQTEAKLVWVTTTPVKVPNQQGRLPEYVLRFNQEAEAIMRANAVVICDTYTSVKAQHDAIEIASKRPGFHDVHFTPEGYALMAKPVAQAIRSLLPSR